MPQILPLLMFLLTGTFSFATPEKDCQSIDLREPGLPMHGAPTFDQGSSDFCWAFAGTQLMSSLLNKHNQGSFHFKADEVTLSPTITMNEATRRMDNFCPLPCQIVEKTLTSKKGCSYKDVQFSDGSSSFHPDTAEAFERPPNSCKKKLSVDQAIKSVDQIISSFQKEANRLKDKWPHLANRLSQRNPNLSSPQRQESLKNFLEKKFPTGLSMADLYNATLAPTCMDLENIQSPFRGSRSVDQVLSSMSHIPASCTPYRTAKFDRTVHEEMKGCPSIPASQITSNANLLEKINQAFSSGQNLPVAIDYCYAFLFDGEPTQSSRLCQFKTGEATSDHKSLLIGRRFNKASNQCEFLLRNSWGKDCSSLHEKYRRICEEEKKKNHTADVWISEKTVEKVTHGVSIIQGN